MAKTAANPRSGTKPKTAASKTTPTKATTPKKSRPSALTKRTPPTKFSFGTGMVGTSGSGADSSVVASGGVLKARFAVVGTTAFHKELTDNGWAGGGGVMLCWSGTAGMDNEKLSVFFRLLIDALADGNGSSFSEQVKAGKTHHRMKLPSGNVKYPLGNNMMCTRRGVGAYDVAVEVYSKKHAQDIWSAVAEAFAEDAAAQKHFTIMPTIPSDIAMPSSESWDDMARVLVGTIGYVQIIDGEEVFVVQGETVYRDAEKFTCKGMFGLELDIKELLSENDMTWRNISIWNKSSGESVDVLQSQGMMMFPIHLKDAVVALFKRCSVPLDYLDEDEDLVVNEDTSADA